MASCIHCGDDIEDGTVECYACSRLLHFHQVDAKPAKLTTTQRIVGDVLIVNGLLVIGETLIDPGAGWTLTPSSPAVGDILLGGLLAAGQTGVLLWVKLRLIAGAIYLPAMNLSAGNMVNAGLQLVFSCAVAGMVFGQPGKLRFRTSLAAVAVVFALTILGFGLTLYGGEEPGL